MSETELVKHKRPRGRPAIPAAERRVWNLTFRSRGGMRDRLAAAAAGGRSLSEEIEARLAQSLDVDRFEVAYNMGFDDGYNAAQEEHEMNAD